jgi:hypothetical protein
MSPIYKEKQMRTVNVLLSGSADVYLFRSLKDGSFFAADIETDERVLLSKQAAETLFKRHAEKGKCYVPSIHANGEVYHV